MLRVARSPVGWARGFRFCPSVRMSAGRSSPPLTPTLPPDDEAVREEGIGFAAVWMSGLDSLSPGSVRGVGGVRWKLLRGSAVAAGAGRQEQGVGRT